MIEATEPLDLHRLALEYPACRERGCSVTSLMSYVQPYTLDDDGAVTWDNDAATAPRWALYHRCADRYGLVPVHREFVDEPDLFYHALDIAHEAMDRLGEKPA